jgi:prepilin-type N-terminal cleavage/methylation domain-containing protein
MVEDLANGRVIEMDRNAVGARFISNGGFSLVEMAIVLMMACTLAGIAVIQTKEVFSGFRSNEAMQQTLSQLRRGRQAAIAQRRSVQLQFLDNNRIQLVRNDPNNATSILSTVSLGNDYQFTKFAEIGPDTPDALGGATAVYFGAASALTFRSDGSLVDQNRIPVNGTISIGLPGHPESARAVTVVGATGRIRGYRWTGSQWIE